MMSSPSQGRERKYDRSAICPGISGSVGKPGALCHVQELGIQIPRLLEVENKNERDTHRNKDVDISVCTQPRGWESSSTS